MTMHSTAADTPPHAGRASLLATVGSLTLAACIALALWINLTGEGVSAPASAGSVADSRTDGGVAPIGGLAELERDRARAAAAEAHIDDRIGGLGELLGEHARAANPPSATMGGVAELIWEQSRDQTATGR